MIGWPSSLSRLSLLIPFAAVVHPVSGHGHLTSPRSRNWVAWEDGVDSPQAGFRTKEYCTHCLNTNTGVCGLSTYNNYDDNLDSMGSPMPWDSQGVFEEGEIITVKSYLDTHHNGHMEIRACPFGSLSTQECFDTPGHELHFVEDVLFGMPKDDNYPERGMYAGGQGGGINDFEMKFKLPAGIYGDQVMLQWKYITANSCSPPGYAEYFGAHTDIPSSYWTTGLGLCTPPYPNDGTRSTTWPEQFFNCAEISVIQGQQGPTVSPKPTLAPNTAQPTATLPPNEPPTLSPTRAPTESSPTYSATNCKASYDALLDMESITNVISTDPPVYSIVASGGAAGGGGDTVSESQAYGILTAAIALASLDSSDTRRPAVMDNFFGMFNGWKTMCENSSPPPCQSPMYCNGGSTACLPGWKHTSDLSTVVGTGSAPDGDEDAIAGMIIALKAVENDSPRPDWYEDILDWTDRSCTQFLADNTKLSWSGSHRLVKLGSCWGGWESDGNNPSYHSPGHYRMMRDFQASLEMTRSYSLPNLGMSLTDAWNSLIDTSYKFLETTKCPDSGLVPNWALVQEVDSQTLSKYPGSFSGSGTPQKEFGAEASRTMWRIAFDAAMYPAESAAQAGTFLAPLQEMMVSKFVPSPLNGWEYFPENTLQGCDHVSNVFGSWNFIGFIFGPVYSALVKKIPDELFQGKSFTQQDMVDVTCDITSNIAPSESYYARSWQVISTMTLNGDISKVSELFHGQQTTSTPTISPKPTPITTLPPTLSPVASPPTSNPVASPTGAPVSPTEGCCSQNFRECVTWCGTTQESCNACSDVFWISGAQTGCLARWDDCTNNVSGCCDGLTCEEVSTNYRQCLPGSGPPPPTPSPPPPTPTAPAPTVSPPTSPPEPTSSGTACCTIDFKNCSPTVEGWCSESETNCVDSCFKFWLPNGAITGCTARYEQCSNDSECCSPGVCVNGQCELSNEPSSPTTDAPTSQPTLPPTDPPVASTTQPTAYPTTSPSDPPVEPEGCFSFNYKSCVHPDYAEMESCNKVWLPNGAQSDCIALWGDCTSQTSSCCGPATCFGDGNYATCVPTTPSSQPTSPCTVCTDIETGWMESNGKDCTTSDLINTKCNMDPTWIANKFCQQSCYDAGNGYDGDVCCSVASRRLRGAA